MAAATCRLTDNTDSGLSLSVKMASLSCGLKLIIAEVCYESYKMNILCLVIDLVCGLSVYLCVCLSNYVCVCVCVCVCLCVYVRIFDFIYTIYVHI